MSSDVYRGVFFNWGSAELEGSASGIQGFHRTAAILSHSTVVHYNIDFVFTMFNERPL